MRTRLAPLLLALAVLHSPAQEDEARVYFSLNVDRPVLPGDQARVRVQAQGVKRLDFRLYKVKDPFAFFRKLDDPHQFGRTAHRTPSARTPIEKFAAWKRTWRARFVDLFRVQFSADNRQTIRAYMNGRDATPAPPKQPSNKGVEFAGVPVLNPQQLVKEWSQPVAAKDRWDPVTITVDMKDKGLYVLEATDQKKQAYSVISVTELALITKASQGRVLVRAIDRRSGAGVAGSPVEIYDYVRKVPLSTASTAADGLLETQIKDPSEEGVLVMASRGADFAVSTISGYQLAHDDSSNLTGYIYTDRPVYRPGHKVHFKSILRTQRVEGYQLPEDSSAQVTIEDADGKTLLKKKMSVSSFGTLSGDVTLPADAPIGYYGIQVGLGGDEHQRTTYGGFHVEEYRKPDYEVKVAPAVKRSLQGRSVEFSIDARYYYGEPVAGAKLTWVVHRYRYWPPWWEVDEDSDFGEDEGGGYGGEEVSQNEATLDADGKLKVNVPLERGDHDYTYRVEARVTDSSNRQISGAASVIATRADFTVTARPDRWVYSPGEEARIIVETRGYDGQPVAGVDFRIDLNTYGSKQDPRRTLLSRTGRTGPDGKGDVRFPAPEGGYYLLETSVPNPAGGIIRETSYLWISGAWSSGASRDERIRMVPDKSSYKPGDTAKVLLVTGVDDCDVWVALEGNGIHWTKVVKVRGGSASVDVPIESRYTPNVFLEAVFVKDNTLYQGSKSLKVPPAEKTIQVEIATSKNEYKPGEPATLELTARDHQGRPVEGEFSVGVVDEAIYAIQKEQQPDIVKAFYGKTWNRVSTETSLEYYFYGEAGRRRMELAMRKSAQMRAQLKPDNPQGPKVRKEFPDTAYWIADLKTGRDGRAKVDFTYPDSLTTWRTTSRGITKDTRVGGAVHRDVVRKDVMITLATPRFFREGDETVVPVLVRNYTAQKLDARVSLAAQGIQIVAGADAKVEVAPRGEARLDYRLKATAASSQAVLTAKALTSSESDAVELTIPIEAYGLKLSSADQKRLDAERAAQNFAFDFPAEASAEHRTATVHLTPSVAGAVFGALEYLISYPYGCTEQTMSSFLPNVIVAQALKDLKLPANIDERDLARKVKAGVERLGNFQHDDGGWGWWQSDDSDPFMTAYVAAGLIHARRAGYQVSDYRLGQAGEWLAPRLLKQEKIAPDTRAFMLYALALGAKPQPQAVEAVWKLRDKMTPFGLAVVGLTMKEIGDARAAAIVTALEASVKRDGDESHWNSNRDPMLDFESDNSLEATAYAVKFLSAAQPQSPLIDGAAQWLVNHRDQGYYWKSTKRTAFVVYGLTGVLSRSGELRPDYRVRITMGGKELLSQRFSAADALRPQPVRLSIPINANHAELRVEKQGAGRLYASINWEYHSTGETQGARALPADNPLRIERTYYRLTPVQSGGRILHRLEEVAGPLKPGDTVAVHLRVTGASNDRYLLVEDPLPSGVEILPRDDLYELAGKPRWWSSWWSRREDRDSKVTFFPYWVPKDGLDFVYLLRFTNAGSYRASPARVEPMYTPGTLSWSAAAALEVKP